MPFLISKNVLKIISTLHPYLPAFGLCLLYTTTDFIVLACLFLPEMLFWVRLDVIEIMDFPVPLKGIRCAQTYLDQGHMGRAECLIFSFPHDFTYSDHPFCAAVCLRREKKKRHTSIFACLFFLSELTGTWGSGLNRQISAWVQGLSPSNSPNSNLHISKNCFTKHREDHRFPSILPIWISRVTGLQSSEGKTGSERMWGTSWPFGVSCSSLAFPLPFAVILLGHGQRQKPKGPWSFGS